MLLEKSKIWTPLQILPKNVGDLGKIIVKKLPKVNKSPNLVTLCRCSCQCDHCGQSYEALYDRNLRL